MRTIARPASCDSGISEQGAQWFAAVWPGGPPWARVVNLNEQWTHVNTETRTCERAPDGTVTCVDDGQHPNGFEWCISAPAVNRDGNVYGLSADGNLYVIDIQGHERQKVFLSKTVASAYTPVSLDSQGRVYAQNNGELYVLGR